MPATRISTQIGTSPRPAEKVRGGEIEVPISYIILNSTSTLATASTAAAEAGDYALSDAAEGVRTVIIKVFRQARETDTVSAQRERALEAKVAALEAQIEDRNVPKTVIFQCKADKDNCMANAETPLAKFECGALYAACLASSLLNFYGK